MTLLTGEKAEKIRAFKSGPVRSNSLHLSNRFFRLGSDLLEIVKSTVDRQGLFIYVQTVHDFFSASMGLEDKQLVSPSFIKNINTRAHIHEPTYLI